MERALNSQYAFSDNGDININGIDTKQDCNNIVIPKRDIDIKILNNHV